MLAVRFCGYGDVDVLKVVEIPRPEPGPGEVLVKVLAAAINPGEAVVRSGAAHSVFPATFPSGQGSDLAGLVEEVGAGVAGWSRGDEVIGFTDDRASHAEYVLAEAGNLTAKPPGIPWEVAGSLYVAGTTAYAMVQSVSPAPGETVVVAGAAGGVGSIAAQLARNAAVTVIGLAGGANHRWLLDHGMTPVSYGPGTIDRVRAAAPDGVDAFLDTFGAGYVEMALELGVPPHRIDTIVDFPAVEKHGVKFEGNAAAGNAQVLAELAALIDAGRLEVPIAASYPLTEVRQAFREVEQRHTHGKIVLLPQKGLAR